MKRMRSAAALLAMAGLVLAGCGERNATSNTAVLGGNAPAGTKPADAHGQALPPPPAPAGTQPQLARPGDDTALAVWVQDGRVLASEFARPGGWGQARALEDIFGEASDPQVASNGRGSAMAVWRHTVGSIQSLRFSRFDAASGWTAPDVLPGALPRPHLQGAAGDDDAPRLSMDAAGIVTARWASGFAPTEEQVARYTPGQGWSRALSEPVASAQAGSPAPPAPAPAR